MTSHAKIGKLQDELFNANRQCANLSGRLSTVKERYGELKEKYDRLVELTKPYIFALQHFPEKVKEFFGKLLPQKERAEEQEQPMPTRKQKTPGRLGAMMSSSTGHSDFLSPCSITHRTVCKMLSAEI